jgi:hypothetical protein
MKEEIMYSVKHVGALLMAALVWVASPASARGLEQSYADLGYLHVKIDGFTDLDGALVDASFGVHEYVNLRGAFIRAGTDDFRPTNDTPDFTEFQLGLRPHFGFAKKKGDLFGEVMYTNSKINGNNFDRSIKGWIYGGGLRYLVLKRTELLIGGEYRSGNVDEWFGIAGAVVKLTRNLSFSANTSQSSDDLDYFAGLRLNF